MLTGVKDGPVRTPDGPSWLAQVPYRTGVWLEVIGAQDAPPSACTSLVLPLLQLILRSERETARLSEELATRYEEIDLLYTISEILGQTVDLHEASRIIVAEVSKVVGARRASILVHDEEHDLLRPVATQGFELDPQVDVAVEEPTSIAARVFRTMRPLVGDPVALDDLSPADRARGYRGGGFLSVPICYAAHGQDARCVGVINLTDRTGGEQFTASDRKLVEAVANQIGAAIENARLAQRERAQQRLHHELELARDLQLTLLPHPGVLAGDAQLAVRCLSAGTVGGDFYTFARLGQGRVGVMVGDVSSHGFPAALVMALVLAAAGIHSAVSVPPDEALRAIRESLAAKLSSMEMYFTVFYGMLDPARGSLTYANAGHPHAFRLGADGRPERLEATAAPLGLSATDTIKARTVAWEREDLLCLWTDGLVDAQNAEGERFGEARLLEALSARRACPPEMIVERVLAEADAFTSAPDDDRTLLVLRL